MAPRQNASTELSRQLGELTAETRALRRDMEAAEKRANEGRARLYAGQERLVARVSELEVKSDVVQATLTTIKPFAEKVDTWEQRGKGAAAAMAALGVLAGSLIAAFWNELASAVRFVLGSR